MLPYEDDVLSAENLIQEDVKQYCRMMKFAYENGPPIYPGSTIDDRRNIVQIQGLSCAHNFSLHIIAVDSIRNHHFAESLGIDISRKKDMTAVVILDSKVIVFYCQVLVYMCMEAINLLAYPKSFDIKVN